MNIPLKAKIRFRKSESTRGAIEAAMERSAKANVRFFKKEFASTKDVFTSEMEDVAYTASKLAWTAALRFFEDEV